MDLTPNIQKWLADKVAEEGKNQAELSAETGISQSTWSRLLNAKSLSIDSDTVTKLCRKFGVTKLDLYVISEKGRLLKETREKYNVRDRVDKLCDFIRSMRRDQQDAFFSLAKGYGYVEDDEGKEPRAAAG